MNEKFTNNSENIADKLNQVVEQTHANSQFVAELETKLRNAGQPKMSRLAVFLKQISPPLRWAVLMILLALVLSLSIKTLIPAPQPATNNSTPSIPNETPTLENTNITPAPQGESFDYGGAQLIVNVPFPDAPKLVNVYPAFRSQPATAEYAQALAAQFGIEGELYTDTTQTQPSGEASLMVTDGKQQLVVYSQNDYLYTSDMVKYSRNRPTVPNENAEAIIREYMTTHGFDLDFRAEAEGGTFGGYMLRQLSPDGLRMDSDTRGSTRVTLDEDGSILSIRMSVIDYETTSLGNFEILPARQALQQMAKDSLSIGSTQSGGSAPDPNLAPPRYWYHDYPDNQPVTVYGNTSIYPAVDQNTPAIIFVDNIPVIGNTSGMEALQSYAFVQVTGQFVMENGVRKLNADTWDQGIQTDCVSGSARRAGDQIIITGDAEPAAEYTLVDPPADLPLDTKSALPDSQLISCGVALDGQFHWTTIQYYTDPSQMGGGGGGGGYFYQLNLSGTPVPFPTTRPTEAPLQPPFDYTVVAGDTCAGIGMAFDVSVESIRTLNSLPADCIISVGQHLKIPYPTPSSAYSSAELSTFPKYIVQPDDTLEKIAESYNVSAEEIRQANGMPDNNAVVSGSTLIIPITRLEGERGIVQVQILEKPDGRRRTSYTFISEKDQAYYTLKGDHLEALQETANRPIKIWGDLSVDEPGLASLNMEKFEPLYPGLQFQVLTGTQETKEIDGQEVALFTTGSTTYIQMSSDGGYPYPSGNSFRDTEEVKIEVLQIPDETYAGYPALRVFVMAPAINPVTGKPMELQGTADEIEVMPDPFGNADAYTAPDTVIEKVELIYYVSDPSYYDESMEPTQLYLQPVWYFYGHDENGDEVHIYIQALRQEYLLPQTEP